MEQLYDCRENPLTGRSPEKPAEKGGKALQYLVASLSSAGETVECFASQTGHASTANLSECVNVFLTGTKEIEKV